VLDEYVGLKMRLKMIDIVERVKGKLGKDKDLE